MSRHTSSKKMVVNGVLQSRRCDCDSCLPPSSDCHQERFNHVTDSQSCPSGSQNCHGFQGRQDVQFVPVRASSSSCGWHGRSHAVFWWCLTYWWWFVYGHSWSLTIWTSAKWSCYLPDAEQAASVQSESPPSVQSESPPSSLFEQPIQETPSAPPLYEPQMPSNLEKGHFSIGNIVYSIVGALLAGSLMFFILYDPIRKAFINLIDKAFGTETGIYRKKRDALDGGLANTVAEAFDAFTNMQDKIETIQGLVRE